MSQVSFFPDEEEDCHIQNHAHKINQMMYKLPVSITRTASPQTYYTIRFLVDRDRVIDAYRAYAYFRWVDNTLDEKHMTSRERLAFVARQQELLHYIRQKASNHPLSLIAEEDLLVESVQNQKTESQRLQIYLQNMMHVMAFDALRRGRLISQQELDDYSWYLASAVTEAMHYFIGHWCSSPCGDTRYQAVIGAHITHMLRDMRDDIDMGYFNIPRELIEDCGIAPYAIESEHCRAWIKSRVEQARDCFRIGKVYLAQVESWRCRLAGYAYMARFEHILDIIERDHYHLRRCYPDHKCLSLLPRILRLVFTKSIETSPIDEKHEGLQ